MLRWFYEGTEVSRVPRKDEFDAGAARIAGVAPTGLAGIQRELARWLDDVASGAESMTSVTFRAGADWGGTPLQVIYDTFGDEEVAAKWLGLALIDAAIRHPDSFYAYRPEAFEAKGLRGLTYFADLEGSGSDFTLNMGGVRGS